MVPNLCYNKGMPYKNRVKVIGTNTYYHAYARGINKMRIYKENADYIYFLYLLKKYLTKDFKEKKEVYGKEVELPVNGVYGQVELNVYSLMPNHFHLLLLNKEMGGMTNLMRRVLTSYTSYFNSKYQRQGPLIQGNYRVVAIRNTPQLITTGIYIHINSLKDGLVKRVSDYPYCSYKYYWGGKKCRWLVPNKEIKESTDYKNFKRYLKDESVIEYSNTVI